MGILLFLAPVLAFSFTFFEGSSYEKILSKMEEARIVYLGEIHDRKDIHKFQLRVLRDLHSRGHKLILLMEAFQQPFQDVLDMYIEGEIDEEEMLSRTEYKKRWGFDRELYAPLWRFARENYVKLFALNVPTELIREARKKELSQLAGIYLPKKVMPFKEKHKEYLKEAFEKHKGSKEEIFFRIQLLWDMGMAYKVAKTALAYPQHKLVVIVGSGHVWRGYGIPERVNFLLGEMPQAVLWVEEDIIYFLFSKDFSKDSSSTNSRREPN